MLNVPKKPKSLYIAFFSCIFVFYFCLHTIGKFSYCKKQPVEQQFRGTISGKFLGFKQISRGGFTNYTSDQISQKHRIVNPHPFVYTLLETEICQLEERGEIFLLVILFTGTNNVDRRNRIRNSWGSLDLQKKLKFALVFPVGISHSWKVSEMIMKESSKHRDIIQETFYDTYYNLTYKSVMWLNWTATYCPQAKYVLKIDDDMFVNIFSLMEYLRNVENQTSSEEQRKEKKMFCWVHWKGSPVIRNPKSKFYVSREEYSENVYGTYCDGRAYVLTNNLILPMYETSFRTKFFRIDDVYTTGLLTKDMGVKFVNIVGRMAIGSYRNLAEKGMIFQETGAMPDEAYKSQWNNLLSQSH